VFLGRTLAYFGKGLIALSIFGAAYLGVGVLTMGMATGIIRLDVILWWVGVVIGGFFGISGLGYLFDRYVLKRVSRFNRQYKRKVKPSNNRKSPK
jgi:hypothetical protein